LSSFLEPHKRVEQAVLAVMVMVEAYVHGVWMRKVDPLVEQRRVYGIGKDRVSAICRVLDRQVRAFR